jgi:1-acyl-sn-glycerol-3-phosphate acyltransferase
MSSWLIPWLPVLLLLMPWLLMPRTRLAWPVAPGQEIQGVSWLLWWLNAIYCAGWHRLQVSGAAPLPERGPALLIANHTCGIDHLLLQASSRRTLGFLIAVEYYDWWPIRPFCRLIGCIPVRRDGRDLGAARAALRELERGRVVPIFPEGHILPTSGRELGEGKPGAAFLALRARVPVIPAYIRGTPATNEILPSLLTPSRARIDFGPPVDLADLAADGGPIRHLALDTATDRLMAALRALRDRPPIDDHGPGATPSGS